MDLVEVTTESRVVNFEPTDLNTQPNFLIQKSWLESESLWTNQNI